MMLNRIRLVFVLGMLSETLCDPFCFVLIQEPKTWLESQLYCREKHLDLATVQSDGDRAKLKKAADAESFSSFAWIGFYNGVLTWRWSYQNKAISYQNWESLGPDTSRTSEACAFVANDEKWGDTSCLEGAFFFCQTDKTTIGEKFVYIRTVLMWREAQLYCRTNHVDLATVSDDTENKALVALLSRYSDWRAWIGLSKNLWLWSDQADVSWSSVTWEPGQPDNLDGQEECASAGTEGQMADVSCSTPSFFYCKTFAFRRINVVRVAVKSAGNLKESAATAAIEEKLNQMLSQQQMDGDFSITWRVQPDGKIFHLQENNTQQTTTDNNTQQTIAVCEGREKQTL